MTECSFSSRDIRIKRCYIFYMRKKYIGAHVSTSGGVENALLHANQIDAAGFAIFTRNQRRWESPSLSKDSIRLFRERMSLYGYTQEMVLPHNSYLINLAQPDAGKRERSFNTFIDELERVRLLGLRYLNFHPGSTVGMISLDEGIALIADGLNRAHALVPGTVPVIETTSGQRNKIGGCFEEIAAIIELIEDKSRIGVCIDTCHVFAAGYDISTAAGWNRMMDEFDRIIGLEYLRGMHLNDSMGELGSRIDRHADIGSGNIGVECFRAVIGDRRTDGIPLILETPAKKSWADEIALLKSFLE